MKINPSCAYHMLRGGSWHSASHYCRVAFRNNNRKSNRNIIVGFRLIKH